MTNLINKEMAALMLGVTTKTVTRWQKREKDPLPLAKAGRVHMYDIGQLHEWGIRQRTKSLGAASDGRVYDYQVERARLTHYQAEKAELENHELRGDLIPGAVVSAIWTESVMNMRARVLAMPSRIAHAVLTAETHAEAHSMVQDACYEALNEIATDELTEEQKKRIEDADRQWAEDQAAAA